MKKIKNAFIIVRVTSDEKDIINERAKELGLSFSELIRKIVTDYLG